MSSKAISASGRVIVFSAALLLSACVSLAPDTGATNTAQDVYSKLDTRDKAYGDAQSSTTKGIGWYNAGIVAATVAAAAAVAFSHGVAATNIIAGAGIGATALTLGYQPGSRTTQYKALSNARAQLNCLQQDMARYHLVGSEELYRDELAKKAATLQKAIGDATIVVGLKPPAPDATPTNLAALTKAIADGSATVAKAQVELTAYEQIDATVTGAYKRIDITVTDALAPSFLTFSAGKGSGDGGNAAGGDKNLTKNSGTNQFGFHVQGAIPAAPIPEPPTLIVDVTKTILDAATVVKDDTIVSDKAFSTAVSVIPTCATATK